MLCHATREREREKHNMETEPYRPETQTHFKKARISSATPEMESHNNNGNLKLKIKTRLCRRFRQGVCFLGSKCNYAHGVADLRRSSSFQFQESKLCRMFSQNKHCTYGHTCRFLHSTTAAPQLHHSPNTCLNISPAQQPPQCRIVQTSAAAAAATIDGYSSAQYNRIMQTSVANASTRTVATSSLHKNGPYSVKFIFKKNELLKISGIYADWI